MNKSEIFKKAHQIAKATVAMVGNYSIAFSFALKEVYAEIKKGVLKMDKTLSEKLIENGAKIWVKNELIRTYINTSDVIEKTLNITLRADQRIFKTKTFIQKGLNGEVVHTEDGSIANAFRAAGYQVIRL